MKGLPCASFTLYGMPREGAIRTRAATPPRCPYAVRISSSRVLAFSTVSTNYLNKMFKKQ